MQKKQGISLIVLVITIIVMVILAAAVVITLSNTGIINRANVAVEKTNQKAVEQLAAVVWAEEYMTGKKGENLKESVLDRLEDYTADYNITITDEGITVTEKNGNQAGGWRVVRQYNSEGLITKAVVTDGVTTYEIGTEVNYMPEGVGPTGAKYTGGWKLLGVDDEGRLLIMSSESITGDNIRLYGTDGFVNGANTLNSTASVYKDGVIGVEARSININDIDTVTGYDPSEFTGEKYIQMYMKLSEKMDSPITEEQALAFLEFSSKEEAEILKNNLEITYSWDGSAFPKCTFQIGEKTHSSNLQSSHELDGFSYYNAETSSFVTVPYTTTPKDIVSIENNAHVYHGGLEYEENCKAYKMLFVSKDGSGKSIYWLANRFTNYFMGSVVFGIRSVDGDLVYGDNQWSSKGLNSLIGSKPARAVVTLASGTTLQNSTTTPGTYDIAQ